MAHSLITSAEARAAGVRDSRHFMKLYRAYLHGAMDGADAERDDGFRMTIAAMVFALLAWSVTLFFVFK